MPILPNPNARSVTDFVGQLPPLTTKAWLTITTRLGSTVEEGGQRAHSIVSGADLNIDGAERAERARLIGLAHDRIADATEAVAATVRYNGEETPLRGLASTVSMHVVNALMSEDRASLRAVSQPFEGFVTIEGFTTAAPAD